MANVSALIGGGVKSIQTGEITISNTSTTATATITAVNTAKSVCFFGGSRSNISDVAYGTATVALTNTTTVTATRGGGTIGASVVVRYTVVEFN